MELLPIGIIHSPFSKPADIHPLRSRYTKGTVEIFDKFVPGLADIEGFSHLYLIWWSHLASGFRLLTTPIMQPDPKRGMFATRIPARPNPICLTVVRLLKRDNNFLHVKGIDVVKGTPLLDIKPYTKRDIKSRIKIGWLDEVERVNR